MSKRRLAFVVCAGLCLAACVALWPARAVFPAAAAGPTTRAKGAGELVGSRSCRQCHERFYDLWSTSHHGLAMQPFSAKFAQAKLTPQEKAVPVGDFRFRADLSATFGVSTHEVDRLFRIFGSPSDVYISLRIGEVAGVPVERVVTQYRTNKKRGWGAIAKELGIQPGSPEFHALKKGRLAAHDQGSGKHGKGHGKAKGHK